MSISAQSKSFKVVNEHEDASRRSALKIGLMSGSGLSLAFMFGPDFLTKAGHAAEEGKFAPNAFLEIGTDGRILIYNHSPEVGQGVITALPMIVAEELDANWGDVDVEQSVISAEIYGRQVAGGSYAVPSSWDQLRQAGAAGRSMLVTAAAEQWGVSAGECSTQDSAVTHNPSGRTLSYGELAMRAAKVPIPDPESLTLKAREDYKILGTRVGGVENDKIVSGQLLYGSDIVIPDMVYATYTRCPAFGGRVVSANLDQVRSMDGVLDAFVLEGTGNAQEVMPGVAVVANSTWAAMKGQGALDVVWDESMASKDSWSGSVARAEALAGAKGDQVLFDKGDADTVIADAPVKIVDALYTYPFIAHVNMEPQHSTAWHRGDEIEVWAPTQTPQRAVSSVAEVWGLPEDKVKLHQIRGGGGFGRRLYNNFVCEAVAISEKVGAPVKLQWTREDDIRHEFYRPGGFHYMSGAVDENGKLAALRDHFVTFSEDGENAIGLASLTETEFPAPLIDNVKFTQSLLPWSIPTGALRAPRSNVHGFVFQSFLHELAEAAGRDYVEFLLEVAGESRWLDPGNIRTLHTGRTADVIKLAADKAGWGKPLPDGHALGLGFYFSHAAHIAEVAEVSMEVDNTVRVHRVTVAADVGPIINMSGAENMMEGSVIDGISTMFGQQLTIENGRIQEGNFDQYPLLKMAEAPEVDVHFIQSEFRPTGLGEPGLPPLLPAVANAIFAATGQRVRSVPLKLEGFAV